MLEEEDQKTNGNGSRTMRNGGSKAKGSSFERVTAKMILDAAALAHLKFGKEDCYRTPGSGGHVYAKKEQPSDLVMSDRLRKHFPVSIECKHYRKVDLSTLFTKNGKVFEWLRQAIGASNGYTPVVVFKWNASKVFCIYPSDALSLSSGHMSYTRFFWKQRYWRVALFSDLLVSVFGKHKGNYK